MYFSLYTESPLSVVAQTLTGITDGDIFCNGSEVIFTCETRGSTTLTWRSNGIYIQDEISFVATVDNIRDTITGSSNDIVANLTQNDRDGGVLVSTLRIIVSSVAPSGFVSCIRANGTADRINFTVIGKFITNCTCMYSIIFIASIMKCNNSFINFAPAPPVIPQDVVTFQLEHLRNMCAIASVLQSPTNQAQADATNYTVSVDGENVPYRNASFNSTDETRHSALLYDATCGSHRITIFASNMCGQSPGTDVVMLDREPHFMLAIGLPEPGGGTSNIECK